jgi:DNA-binding NtrC family response regulator/tetratricopeptide (TPR) repeat protein
MHRGEGEDSEVIRLAKLGDLCLAVGSVTDALDYFRQALSRTPAGDEAYRLGLILKITGCLRRMGRSDEALDIVESTLGSFTGRSRRDLLAEKANLLCLTGKYGEAVEVCEAVRQADPGIEREKDAGVYLVLGHVLARLCRWKQAIVCLEQAATFGRMCGDLKTVGNALNNLGIVYKNLCRFGDSARYLRKAVRAARGMSDQASLAVRLLNLSTTMYKQGEISRARRSVDECIKISALLNLTRTNLLASICQARLDAITGKPDRAMATLKAAVHRAESLDDRRTALVGRESIGEIMVMTGHADEARSMLEGCLAKVPDARDVEAEVKSRLAETYMELGRLGPAEQTAREAAAIAEDIGDLFEAGRALRVAGLATKGGGASLARAEQIFRKIGSRLELAITLYHMSQASPGDASESTRRLREALAIFRACRALEWRVRAQCALAREYARISQYEQASACLDEAKRMARDNGRAHEHVKRARAALDASISRGLPEIGPADASSPEGVYRALKSRLGACGAVLARLDEKGCAQPISSFDLGAESARALAAAVASKAGGPFVSTDAASVLGLAAGEGLGSLLGVRLSCGGRRALFAICWPADGHGRTRPGSLVEAYYEVARMTPALERGLVHDLDETLPVCLGGIVTADEDFKSILLTLPRIAEGTANVLVCGETGTGKELIAAAIHMLSSRRDLPFVVQNCAALPEQLLESELFGHKAGAFTGARGDKKGLVEMADGGTFLLDEIGDVSPAIQAKMLRVIETGEIRRVGDTAVRRVDVRFLSATNRDLAGEAAEGRFRLDLLYRLNVVAVKLPPLRCRASDIPILSRLFLNRFAKKAGKRVDGIAEEAMRALVNYDWPGNVRQLENEIEKAVTLVRASEVITPDLLSAEVTGGLGGSQRLTLRDELRSVERRRIMAALRQSGWNKSRAARLIGGISRPALIAKMKRLGIPLKP